MAFDRLANAANASQADHHPFNAVEFQQGAKPSKTPVDLEGLQQESSVMAANMQKTMRQAVNALVALHGPEYMLEAYSHPHVDKDLKAFVQDAVKAYKA